MATAIFPAAGQSRRMQKLLTSVTNKNFLELNGFSILIRTLQTFSKSDNIDYLIIAAAADEIETINSMLNDVSDLKPFIVVKGGSERQYSIANALREVPTDCEIILVHDAARPLIDVKTIDNVVDAAKLYGGAIAAVPEKNTIKVIDKDNFVINTPQRSQLVSVQTPQGFQRDILIKAYKQAEQDNFLGTDDSSLVERLGYKVKIVKSDYCNIKITTPEDILIAEAFLRSND
ncbi:MAG: 2-C-methyl-D-erythritol 4-phosphate cytidylyltransferase [Selenomonadaceae bacterium]|nr:2-C-methyl-D-erythritol 4-phosphate cytidylyltransferase [Selenomonadaceae bacterium]